MSAARKKWGFSGATARPARGTVGLLIPRMQRHGTEAVTPTSIPAHVLRYTEMLRTHMRIICHEMLDPHLPWPLSHHKRACCVRANVEYISSLRTVIPSITILPILSYLWNLTNLRPQTESPTHQHPQTWSSQASHPILPMRAK